MSGLDPIPHLRIAQKPPSSKFGCPVATHARLVQFWLTGLKNGSLDKPEQSELAACRTHEIDGQILKQMESTSAFFSNEILPCWQSRFFCFTFRLSPTGC